MLAFLLLGLPFGSADQCSGTHCHDDPEGRLFTATAAPASSRLISGFDAFAHAVHDCVAEQAGAPVLTLFFNGSRAGDAALDGVHAVWGEAAAMLAREPLNRGSAAEILRLDTAAAENARLPANVLAAPPSSFAIKWCYWQKTPTSHHPACMDWGGLAAPDADDDSSAGAVESAAPPAPAPAPATAEQTMLRAVHIYKAVRSQVGMPYDILPSAAAVPAFELNNAGCPAIVLGFWWDGGRGQAWSADATAAFERVTMRQSRVCFGWSSDPAVAKAFGVVSTPGMVKRWRLPSGEYVEALWKQAGAANLDEEHMAAFAFGALPPL